MILNTACEIVAKLRIARAKREDTSEKDEDLPHSKHIQNMKFIRVKNPHTWNLSGEISRKRGKKVSDYVASQRRLHKKWEGSPKVYKMKVCPGCDWQTIWSPRDFS